MQFCLVSCKKRAYVIPLIEVIISNNTLMLSIAISLSKKIIHLLHKKSILWKLLFIYFLSFCSFESIQGNIMYYSFFPLPITINRYCRCSCSRVQSTLCSNFMMVTSLFAPIHLGLRVPCSLSRIATTFLQRAMKRLERALANTIGMSGSWVYGSR